MNYLHESLIIKTAISLYLQLYNIYKINPLVIIIKYPMQILISTYFLISKKDRK